MVKKQVKIDRVGPAKKAKFAAVDRLAKEIEKNKTVMVVDLTGMPSHNLSQIRRDLRGKAKFKITKKTIIEKSLEKVGRKGFDKLVELVSKAQPAIIISNEDPFKLSRVILKHVRPAHAKAGKIPETDIVVLKGDTGLPPGPAIGELQKANLPARIEKGKIIISKDTVIAKAGEPIAKEAAEALLKLGMEPFEVKLNVLAALEDGLLYPQDALFLDEATVVSNITTAGGETMNLAVFISWPAKETIELLLGKANRQATAIAKEAGIETPDTVGLTLANAHAKASALAEKVGGTK